MAAALRPCGEGQLPSSAGAPLQPVSLVLLPTPHNASPFCLRSPHPVKPLSAAPLEGSPDRKQPRSSLSTALSSGLEKLKTVTSGGIQPVAPAPNVGQTVDSRGKLKVRPDRMPGMWCGGERPEVRSCVLGRVEGSTGPGPHAGALKPVRWPLALETEAAPGPIG